MSSSSVESMFSTLFAMSVKVTMPTSFSFFITGSFLTFFVAMSLAASSMLAVSLMVNTGVVMICLAVRVSGVKHGSTTLLSMSRSDITPTGLSSCTTIMEPMLNLFMVAATSLTLESGGITLTFFDMTSLTRTLAVILFLTSSMLCGGGRKNLCFFLISV